MNRKDIETFVEIQNRLHTYSKNVLSTLGKDYPECGISDIARVIGLDVIGDYLQLTYSSYPLWFNSQDLFLVIVSNIHLASCKMS